MEPYAWRPISHLSTEWAALSRSAGARDAACRLAAEEPAVAALGARDLGELVDMLGADAPARVSAVEAAGVVRAMLRSRHVHPLVDRAILQALVPGLVGVARRLAWGRGGEWPDGGAFFVDAVTTAWEVIAEWSGQDRPYAVLDLLSAVRCRLRRQLLRHRGRLERAPVEVTSGAPGADRRAGTTATDLDELARVLDDLWGRGVDSEDAAVLYAHRVLGYSLTELSAMTGRSRRYLSERRDRAANVLTA